MFAFKERPHHTQVWPDADGLITLDFTAVTGLPEVAALAIWLDDKVSFPDAVALPLPDPGLAAQQPPDPFAPVGPAAPAQSLDLPEGPALQPPVPAGELAVSPSAGDLPGPPPPGVEQPTAPQAGAAAAGPAPVPSTTAGAPAVTPQRLFVLGTDAAGSGSPASLTSPTAGQGQVASPAAGPSAASPQASGPAYSPAAAPDVGTAAAAAGAPQSGAPAAAPASPGRTTTPEPPEPSSGSAAAAAGSRPAAESAPPPAAWPPPDNFLQVMRWPPATDPGRKEFYADAALPALPGLLAAQLAPADLSAPLNVAGAYGAAGGGGGAASARARGQALFMWLAIYSESPSASPCRSSTRQDKSSIHEKRDMTQNRVILIFNFLDVQLVGHSSRPDIRVLPTAGPEVSKCKHPQTLHRNAQDLT